MMMDIIVKGAEGEIAMGIDMMRMLKAEYLV
ncbi:hypothetical protein G5S_0940 [Chlamydia pecorum E58]|uniref:Uncharacterized protein n=1 Tax=Chlamydia pecorum (strain ATCC VR-628 / DSM 29919 / E58) TaxID=331635 RepID=A0AA34RDU0_CHLPE|nr:hypothetical protein G5S_0940 [Chlamydia pecorum E58]